MIIFLGRKLARLVSFLAIAVIVHSCSDEKGKYAQEQKPVVGSPAHRDVYAVSTWNRAAAANYLNQRETWWMQWEDAKSEQDTFCVSSHTNLPFVFPQAALHEVPTETHRSDTQRKIIANVKKGVRVWDCVAAHSG